MATEVEAAEILERRRWGEAPVCPRCGSPDFYKMLGKYGRGSEREKWMRWRCRSCMRQSTVRTGTPLEDSRLPFAVWLHMMLCVEGRKEMPTGTEIQAFHPGQSKKSAFYTKIRLWLAMPVFGFRAPAFNSYFKDRCLPRCPTCRGPSVNTQYKECPRCRVGARLKKAADRYADERREWSIPSKEATWWKIAEVQLRATNRLLRSPSRPGAAPSSPDGTLPV